MIMSDISIDYMSSVGPVDPRPNKIVIPPVDFKLYGDPGQAIAINANFNTPISFDGGLKFTTPTPITANIGGTSNAIKIDLNPAINLDANLNLSMKPVEASLNLDVSKPVTLAIGKTVVAQNNTFTVLLFGFIPLFKFRTSGTININ